MMTRCGQLLSIMILLLGVMGCTAVSSPTPMVGEPHQTPTMTMPELITRNDIVTVTPFAIASKTATTLPPITARTPITVTSVLTPSKNLATPSPASDLRLAAAADPVWRKIIEAVGTLEGFYTLAISPDGKLLAAVENDDTDSIVYLWEIDTGNLIWSTESDRPIAVTKLIFSPDGNLLVVGAGGAIQDVFVWDVATGEQLYRLSYLEYTVDMAFSPDSHLLAMGGVYPGSLVVWDFTDLTPTGTEVGIGYSVDFVPNSSTPILAVAKGRRLQSDVSPVYLLNIQSNQREYIFPNTFYADGVAISPDGQILAALTANEEGESTLRAWHLHDKREIYLEASELGLASTQELTISPTGNIILLTKGGTLLVWDATGHLKGILRDPDIKGFLLTPDGRYLLTHGLFKTPLKVWDILQA